jgi:nucleotide-binding universal stress UspA family protein
VANTRKADLIIMGSRGLGTLAGLVLGSQSQKVISHAPCPVLVVR